MYMRDWFSNLNACEKKKFLDFETRSEKMLRHQTWLQKLDQVIQCLTLYKF